MERIMRFGIEEPVEERRAHHLQPQWYGIGIPKPQYPLDVAGDINCTGTLRINGVPITAFSLGTANKPVEIIAGDNIDVVVEGHKIIIHAKVPEYPKQRAEVVRHEPDEWKSYQPKFTDKGGRTPVSIATGQFTIFGGVCFVQTHVEVRHTCESPLRVSLPAAPKGSVKQSLNVYSNHGRVANAIIQGAFICFDVEPHVVDKATFLISGHYRVG